MKKVIQVKKIILSMLTIIEKSPRKYFESGIDHDGLDEGLLFVDNLIIQVKNAPTMQGSYAESGNHIRHLKVLVDYLEALLDTIENVKAPRWGSEVKASIKNAQKFLAAERTEETK